MLLCEVYAGSSIDTGILCEVREGSEMFVFEKSSEQI